MIELLQLPQTFAIDSFTKLVMILIFYIGPFGFIVVILERSFGFMGTLSGALNNKAKGLHDRNRNWRGAQRKEGYQKSLEERSRGGKTMVAGIARRAKLAQEGGFSFKSANRARYRAASQALTSGAADEAVKRDGGRSGGNDDLMADISAGKSEPQILKDYSQKLRVRAAEKSVEEARNAAELAGKEFTDADKDAAYQRGYASISQEAAHKAAVNEVASFKANFGIDDVGSKTAQVAAFKAWSASNTSAKGDDWDIEIADRASKLIDSGAISLVDAAATIKSNKMRVERSGVGFSDWMSTLNKATENRRVGKPLLDDAMRFNLRESAINGSEPGQIMGGRHESVKLLSPHLAERLKRNITAGNSALVQRDLSTIAQWKDVAGQVSPLKNDHVTEKLMNTQVTPMGMTAEDSITVNDYLEATRKGVGTRIQRDDSGAAIIGPDKVPVKETYTIDNEIFHQRRRDFEANGGAAAGAAAARQYEQAQMVRGALGNSGTVTGGPLTL